MGAALAVGLAAAGATIFALDVQSCRETVAQVRETGRYGVELACDLAGLTPERAQTIVEACVAEAGGLDILVNNAEIIRRAPALEYAAEDWQAVLDINLSAVFLLSQAAARHFAANAIPGKIIQVASMLSFQGGLFVPAYAAAKSGIAGLTHALANEWAGLNINVNAIAPGYIETEVTAGLRADAERNAAILSRIPAGRWGKPEDVQGAAVFLASDAARYVHGILLPIDGGWLAR